MGVDRDYEEFELSFQQGLVENVEDSMLPVNSSPILRNWQADPNGGLRVRRGWRVTARTGINAATSIGRGIGVYTRPAITYNVPSIIGVYGGATAGATSYTATLSNPSVAGNCLVATLILGTNSTGVVVPTDFTLAKASVDGLTRIYVAGNCPSKSSVAFSWTTSQAATLSVSQYTNIDTTTAVDVVASNTGTSAAPDSGTTAATATPNDVAFAVAVNVDGNHTPYIPLTNGFTYAGGGAIIKGGGGSYGYGFARKFMSAAEAANTTFTAGASLAWQGTIITLKASVNTDPVTTFGYYAVASVDSTDYKISVTDKNALDSAVWTEIDSITPSSGNTSDAVAFVTALNKLLYTCVRFATARQWEPSGGAASIATGPAGRCIAFHRRRIYIGGTSAEPTLLYFSDVDSTAFTGGTSGSIYVGREDGEPIEEIITTAEGLLIGKENSLWYLTGSGNDNFQLIQLGDGGCAPGRSMARTPYGTFVAGREYAYLVNGSQVDTISEPIENSYGMTGDWMSTSYRNGRCTVLDQGSGNSFVFDFRRKIWQGEERVATAAEVPAVLFAHGAYELFTPSAATINGLLGWRVAPDGDRVKDFDTLAETFETWTPELWLGGPQTKFTPRYLFLKLRQRVAGEADNPLVVTPYFDGTEGDPMTIDPRPNTGGFWVRKSLGQKKGISSIQLQFLHELGATQDAVFDIEKGIIGYNVEYVR